ncbi:hypothetical protein [Sphingobacterium sp. SGR-19]|uniref:hypothetical protein n=1 Tax=Sphingobacterium sp. SGR-19 TaxID=2710886 RepID=UPI0013E9EBAA|nr:hypothetical protein [Sphingobacterium sp. SGR-19]NGM63789.1 hypothetical protein [Sphingobacterium sp. SGR-19]
MHKQRLIVHHQRIRCIYQYAKGDVFWIIGLVHWATGNDSWPKAHVHRGIVDVSSIIGDVHRPVGVYRYGVVLFIWHNGIAQSVKSGLR